MQYKDLVPKHPLSAYMLFSQAKGPKLKEKYPNMNCKQMAVKLGKRWQTMGAEKQEKYKQQSLLLRKAYNTEMEMFYQEHPDARPPPSKVQRSVCVRVCVLLVLSHRLYVCAC